MGVYDMLMRSMRSQLCRRYEEVDKRELEDGEIVDADDNDDKDYHEQRIERRGVVIFRQAEYAIRGLPAAGNR
jgi:hypothetical protein